MGRESERRPEVEGRKWKAGKETGSMAGSDFTVARMF